MRLIVGLGPIGGNVGANLAQRGHDVYGYDFDSERVREWSTETTSPAGSDLPAVDWSTIESVHIAVRLADQVTSVFTALKEQTSEPLTVYVHTTLAPTDARNIMGSAPTGWRVFEAPVSGGPQGARNGTMTVFLAGPSGQSADDALLDAMAGNVFRMGEYGQPATLKLLNNTLATYNLASTARILNLADQLGMPAGTLLDVIGVSTGQSWMGDNIIDVQYDLLLKDVALLRNEVDSLPAGLDNVEESVLHARTLLEKSGGGL
ncbi:MULTISPECIES: NAD(P)-dependent oxidoreductase [Nocardiaceae]|jgi:3-hydroxyisobutyrate dehydrogenase-like beta-hydroxyacid dehydrogenase|uniref:NAD(P)-dependent oxidoreductase n=1 Tax=Nocardiaceae TaxID=85025 RepID=UPI001E578D2C|nr:MULTISPECIES: NAD(P)-binding domain-containing protein [Rhodococcus]MCC8927035.1 NAD-binding protein [Rhodococcus sp. I2R]MCZ4278242.1 NAD(P)-binding domain-containing protein [Rhodococcus yunnanensis]